MPFVSSVSLPGKLKEQMSTQMDRKRKRETDRWGKALGGYLSWFLAEEVSALLQPLTIGLLRFGDLVIQTWEKGLEGEVSIGTDRQTEGRTDGRKDIWTDMASPRLHPRPLTRTRLHLYILQRYKNQISGRVVYFRSRNQDVAWRLSCRGGR